MTSQPASVPPLAPAPDDYRYELQVNASAPDVVTAVTDDAQIRAWWTAATRTERNGDALQLFMSNGKMMVEFTIDHAPATNEVVWTVTDCVMDDWIGTKQSFSVRANGDGTTSVEFRHVGLRPALECFDQCRAGWNHFMPSLHQFLETGVGRPNEPRDASA
jgi:hypothetical protein